jgi:hypothetical protein
MRIYVLSFTSLLTVAKENTFDIMYARFREGLLCSWLYLVVAMYLAHKQHYHIGIAQIKIS